MYFLLDATLKLLTIDHTMTSRWRKSPLDYVSRSFFSLPSECTSYVARRKTLNPHHELWILPRTWTSRMLAIASFSPTHGTSSVEDEIKRQGARLIESVLTDAAVVTLYLL